MEMQRGPAGVATAAPTKPARGGCLTSWLVLILIANCVTALLTFLNPDRVIRPFHRFSHGLVVLIGLAALANVVFVILIWNWRRVGFWGAVVIALLALPVNWYLGMGLLHIASGLLGIAILALLVRTKWGAFK
jgi:hypothetical protein